MYPNGKLPITLVVITANEEQNIARCLSAANFCSEIVLVDSGSTDRTLEIAGQYGARIVRRKWQGYHDQKRFACEQATEPWILCIDADEVVSPELRQAIEGAFLQAPAVDGFELNRHGVYGKTPINHSGWYPQWRLFLFRRGSAHWAGRDPHPVVQFDGATKRRLAGDLLHFTCRDTRQHITKNVSLAQAAAAAMHREGRKATLYDFAVRPPWAIFRTYILQLGFLDGMKGCIIAVTTGFCTYIKYAMLRELRKQDTWKARQECL